MLIDTGSTLSAICHVMVYLHSLATIVSTARRPRQEPDGARDVCRNADANLEVKKHFWLLLANNGNLCVKRTTRNF